MATTDNLLGPLKSAAVLLLTGTLAAAGLAALQTQTAERFAANQKAYALRQLNELIPADRYNNDIFNDTVDVVDADLLGDDEPKTVFRARRGDEIVAVVIETVAPRGYSGPIHLLVGIDSDGKLAGVRASSHRETPGLGDKIDISRSRWIESFAGRSLTDPEPQRWSVRRDGGEFDQFTGATVTPRAVVSAVRDALLYFDSHRSELLRLATPSEQ